jgi:hypothetical protein
MKHILATYIGDENSCGLTKDKRYTLQLKHCITSLNRSVITIADKKGNNITAYESMESLLNNWDCIINLNIITHTHIQEGKEIGNQKTITSERPNVEPAPQPKH